MRLLEYLNHNAFKLWNVPYGDDVDYLIIESFNSNLTIEKVNGLFDFSTKWKANDSNYTFEAKKFNDNKWSVGFIKDNDFNFKKADTNKFTGDIFTGVFKSLKLLLEENIVNEISFSTDKTNTWLVDFYKGGIFKRYIEKHYKFKFKEECVMNGMLSWTYINLKSC